MFEIDDVNNGITYENLEITFNAKFALKIIDML